jgi:acetyl esterase/lipase
MRPAAILLLAALPLGAADPPRRFKATTEKDALAWQAESRKFLADALKLDGVPGTTKPFAFNEKVLRTSRQEEFTWSELELSATRGRRMKAVLTVPISDAAGTKFPAVVCIHGHSGSRFIVYDPLSLYRGFATELAKRGYVTISVEVGQHNVYEEGRTLMGERLNDVVRCVDYLVSRKEVDAGRIGCAGLSLGGEMTMWLGAMDTRVKATVSSGFLTTVANMRQGHCPCWDFKAFSDNFDFADIYGLIAPRALLCQIGREERAPGGFPVDVAEAAMADVRKVYAVFGKKDKAVLDLHPAGHVYVNKTTIPFLDAELRP